MIGERRIVPRLRDGANKRDTFRISPAEFEDIDPWESRRAELHERGDVFDAFGRVTDAAHEGLMGVGWNDEQIRMIEDLQKNYIGAVEVIPGKKPDSQQRGAMSAVNREDMLRSAHERADQELTNRDQGMSDLAAQRAKAGRDAYDQAIRRGYSEENAKSAQRIAEQAFDARNQDLRNQRAA